MSWALGILATLGARSLLRWLSTFGTHRHVVEAVHISDENYRIEYECQHRGRWYAGWVIGARDCWHHEETMKRVHPKVSAWLYRHWGALERHRRNQPLQMEIER